MISVVVPVFNERESLEELHRRLDSVLASLGPHEIVLVDDRSEDGSWELMLSLAARDPSVRLVRLSRNFGQQAALSAGLDAARGDAVVLIDADLQDPPEVIPELVARWHEGFDVVYAVRTHRDGEPALMRTVISVFYRLFRRMSPLAVPEDTADFRLLSRRAADAVRALPERARYLRGLTTWVGFRQAPVHYRRDARYAGRSTNSIAERLRLALDGITSFSTVPIKVVTGLGFVIVGGTVLVIAWALYARFFTSHTLRGWASVFVLVAFLGGVQLIALGVIGQYIARIFEETKRRPLYLVDEVVESRQPAAEEARSPVEAAT